MSECAGFVIIIIIIMFPGAKRSGRGVDYPLHQAPSLNGRAIPPLPLWSFMVGYRVSYTLLLLLLCLCNNIYIRYPFVAIVVAYSAFLLRDTLRSLSSYPSSPPPHNFH